MLKRPKVSRKLPSKVAKTLAKNYSGARRRDLFLDGTEESTADARSHLRVAQEIYPTSQELYETLTAGNYSLLSPDLRANPQETSKKYEQLTRTLKDMNLQYTPAVGVYEGQVAPVLMIYDIPVETLIQLGKELQQESVIFVRNGNPLKLFTWGPQQGTILAGEKPTLNQAGEFTMVKTVDNYRVVFSFKFSSQPV